MARMGEEVKNLDLAIEDITTEFNYLTLDQLREALRKGSLGEFGYTYKLSIQVICIWIREYVNKSGIIFTKKNPNKRKEF